MQEQEQQPGGWVLAFRFGSADTARATYEIVRDAVLTDDADASVFRFTLDGMSHVTLVGETPPPLQKIEQAESLMARAGVPATLPGQVLGQLLERRKAFKSTGLDYFERRS